MRRWLTVDYVALPIGVTCRTESAGRVRLYGAIESSYLVRATRVIDDINEDSETDITDRVKRWDLAPVIGLSVAPFRRFELALQHGWGTQSVYEADWPSLKNRSLWLLGTVWINSR